MESVFESSYLGFCEYVIESRVQVCGAGMGRFMLGSFWPVHELVLLLGLALKHRAKQDGVPDDAILRVIVVGQAAKQHPTRSHSVLSLSFSLLLVSTTLGTYYDYGAKNTKGKHHHTAHSKERETKVNDLHHSPSA